MAHIVPMRTLTRKAPIKQWGSTPAMDRYVSKHNVVRRYDYDLIQYFLTTVLSRGEISIGPIRTQVKSVVTMIAWITAGRGSKYIHVTDW